MDTSDMSTTIRVSEATRDRFAALARTTGRPMTELLDAAATALERDLFFTALEQRFDELRGDEAAWAEVEEERGLEATSLTDSSR